MSDDDLMLGVTTNVGCGGPHSPQRVDAMTRWAHEAVRRKPVIVFAQETPAAGRWLQVWTGAGYRPVWGVPPLWRVRSVLLARADVELEPLSEDHWQTLRYHGSYLASAHWVNPPSGTPRLLASVHASPTPAEPARYGWPRPLPEARDGGPASPWRRGQLWDSDLLLVTLAELAGGGSGLVAAGDFNETFTGDIAGVTWAEEYREAAKNKGLHDALLERWRRERPTRFPPNGAPPVQLDHVLVDSRMAGRVARRHAAIDTQWRRGEVDTMLSDHAPVWFDIDG